MSDSELPRKRLWSSLEVLGIPEAKGVTGSKAKNAKVDVESIEDPDKRAAFLARRHLRAEQKRVWRATQKERAAANPQTVLMSASASKAACPVTNNIPPSSSSSSSATATPENPLVLKLSPFPGSSGSVRVVTPSNLTAANLATISAHPASALSLTSILAETGISHNSNLKDAVVREDIKTTPNITSSESTDLATTTISKETIPPTPLATISRRSAPSTPALATSPSTLAHTTWSIPAQEGMHSNSNLILSTSTPASSFEEYSEDFEADLYTLLSDSDRTKVLHTINLLLKVLHFVSNPSPASSEQVDSTRDKAVRPVSFQRRTYTLSGEEENLSLEQTFLIFVQVGTALSKYLMLHDGPELEKEIQKLEERLMEELTNLGAVEVKSEERAMKEVAVQVEPHELNFASRGVEAVAAVPRS